MSAFDKLLGELDAAQAENDTLAKSLNQSGEGAGDDTLNGGAGGEDTTAGAGGADTTAGASGGDTSLVKSFKVKLDDGTEVDAVDGGEMLKALEQRLDGTEGTMAKAMGQLVGLVKGQSALIKSLGEQVTALRGEGRGRKAVVSIIDKTPAGGESAGAAAVASGDPVGEFLAKSEAAWKGGKISGQEFTTIDVAARTGVAVDAALVKKVTSA